MYYALISFKSIPKVGFAHHFYAENYKNIHKISENSLEIVYIKEGALTITFGEKTMVAEPGSVFVYPRQLPFSFSAPKKSVHKHCTVQINTDFDFAYKDGIQNVPKDFPGLIVPFITPPSHESEEIKKKLYSIISDISVSYESNCFSSAICCVGILERLSNKCKKSFLKDSSVPSLLCHKIKLYVAEHINEVITLSHIEKALGKTSIYLNSVFKKTTGTTIHQYINSEKIRLISALMENREMPFKQACESVGIMDISYGYRMFKKQTGITPGDFKNSYRHEKDD